MSYTKEMLDKNVVKFSFETESEDWKNAIDEAYNKVKGKFQIGGFRKGHVPRKVIESNYGVGVFFEDALDIILPKYYEQALDENEDIFTVDRPNIDIVAISDTTLKFTATVQLKPTVKLGAYTGLEFKKDKVKVTKEEIKAEVDKALEQAGSWEAVADRTAANGDNVTIDYSGSVDGVKFDGGTAEKAKLELGSHSFIPGFEEQVVGMAIGESKDIQVEFPEEYGAKELAGKKAVFAVTLHEITTKITPAYDDEFVKDVSDFDTVEKYEENIKNTIKTTKEGDAEFKLENDIVTKISELAEVDVPECMVERRAEEMVQSFEEKLAYQGMKKEDYYKYSGSSAEDVKARYMDTAKKNVRISLVLEEIMKEVKIPVGDEEIESAIAELAKKANRPVEEYAANMNDEIKNYLRSDIINTKLFDYLKNNNTVK